MVNPKNNNQITPEWGPKIKNYRNKINAKIQIIRGIRKVARKCDTHEQNTLEDIIKLQKKMLDCTKIELPTQILNGKFDTLNETAYYEIMGALMGKTGKLNCFTSKLISKLNINIDAERITKINDHTIAFLDVDYLKKMNSAHGHAYVDVVLGHLTGIINEVIVKKGKGLVYSIGGDEFLINFWCDKNESIKLIKTIRKEISKLETISYKTEQGTKNNLSVSIGLVHANGDANKARIISDDISEISKSDLKDCITYPVGDISKINGIIDYKIKPNEDIDQRFISEKHKGNKFYIEVQYQTPVGNRGVVYLPLVRESFANDEEYNQEKEFKIVKEGSTIVKSHLPSNEIIFSTSAKFKHK